MLFPQCELCTVQVSLLHSPPYRVCTVLYSILENPKLTKLFGVLNPPPQDSHIYCVAFSPMLTQGAQ